MVGTRRGGRSSKASDLAIVLVALGEVWADSRRQELEFDRRLEREPASNVVSLAGRRSREVPRAS